MSMRLMVDVMRLKLGNPVRKLVYLKLADNANDQGTCYPSIQHISDYCECSKPTVINHIKWLEKNGYLTVKRTRKSNNENNVNIYILTPLQGSKNTLPPSKADLPPSKNTLPQGSKNTLPKPVTLINQSINQYIDYDIWCDFVAMRKAIRKPLTDGATSRLSIKLLKMRDDGHDINKCMVQSVINCWQDVFPLRGEKNEATKASKSTELNEAINNINDIDW